ncbi:non-ribosomal peptide synthetase [Brevibacillus laterosporus]|uniref:non-ribosomal peptide synthetase n=1 Tax=Brevibacillus laterosporus TaxID=1465 RepID=UPI000CE57C21|nr:non-ribosomal peptide synthetase [Brevibacillus laterosporus]PPA82185.1 non-ribosomal peptide synthetase [Brevibacillus laterosporus]
MKSLTDRINLLSDKQRELLEKQLKKKNVDVNKIGINKEMINPRGHSNASPLTYDQERLWFFNRMHPESHTYNVYGAAKLTGTVHHWALEKSINEIVKRHEAWRTVFDSVDGQARQIVLPELQISVPEVDLRLVPDEIRDEEVQRQMKEEVQRLFDLKKGPLIRFKLFHVSNSESMLVMTVHHIVIDRITFSIFFKELSLHYQAVLSGIPVQLSELPIQYADYAEWQRNYFEGETKEKLLTFWREQLADCDYVLDISTDFPRPPAITYRGARCFIQTPLEVLNGLKAIGQKENASAFMIILAAFKLLLYRYTGQSDILVGTPLANRSRVELEDVMGYFLTMGTLRTRMSKDMTFIQLLHSVRETALAVYKHQDMPIGLLIDELKVPMDVSRNPLVQAIFVYVDVPEEKLQLPDLTVEFEMIDAETAKYDITAGFSETEKGLEGFFEYSPDLFRKDTIERMREHWHRLLHAILENPHSSISDLAMLTEGEEQQLLIDWNSTNQPFSDNACIHELFEAQVEKTPDQIALKHNDQVITYEELNKRANQVAHLLKKRGVERETLVGMYMERSIEMIVGVLGILKAGGAYIPIDPIYPIERVRHILQDSGLQIVLTSQHLNELMSKEGRECICLDNEQEAIACEDIQNLPTQANAHSLAYVIYTSGSTGDPKGVMIEHQGLCNITEDTINTFDITSDSKLIQIFSISFDASAHEIFSSLCAGATLCLTSPDVRAGGKNLLAFLHENQITTMFITPSVLATLNPDELPESLQTVLSAGELCTVDMAEWSKGPRKLYNGYGQTETSIISIVHLCTQESLSGQVGRPFANMQVYILDDSLNPVPIGVKGEIYVGGVGVARGYMNQPELTAAKFVHHRFAQDQSARLYRTGDLGRFLVDGTIEYLGRRDNQIKIRGYRIELDEIGNVLVQHPSVNQAKVSVHSDTTNKDRLVSYIVIEEGQEISSAELRTYLQQKLPDYMVPAYYIFVDSLPKTTNGKINRDLLPAPEESFSQHMIEYVPPKNEWESKLARIWGQVLNLKQVSVVGNFFDLGGHSLKTAELVDKIKETFQVELLLRNVFEYPTVRQMALLLEKGLVQKKPFISFRDNTDHTKEVICFPPMTGQGVLYKALHQKLSGCILHAFDFIRGADRIEQYVHYIKEAQSEGPYVVLGYSAGGNLAFEVAKKLEEHGLPVSDLIIVDAPLRVEALQLDIEKIQSEAEALVNLMAQHLGESIRTVADQNIDLIKEYYDYTNKVINEGVLSANIHIITSNETTRDDIQSWENSTINQVYVHKGSGEHMNMLIDPTHLTENARVIATILKGQNK